MTKKEREELKAKLIGAEVSVKTMLPAQAPMILPWITQAKAAVLDLEKIDAQLVEIRAMALRGGQNEIAARLDAVISKAK